MGFVWTEYTVSMGALFLTYHLTQDLSMARKIFLVICILGYFFLGMFKADVIRLKTGFPSPAYERSIMVIEVLISTASILTGLQSLSVQDGNNPYWLLFAIINALLGVVKLKTVVSR